MKTFVKGLSALLICGTFIFASCDKVEAAESKEATKISESAIAEFNVDSLQTEELGFRHDRRRPYPPPPPPPRHPRPPYSPPPESHPPYPPPPPHHMPPPPPHHMPPPPPHHMPPPPPPGW